MQILKENSLFLKLDYIFTQEASVYLLNVMSLELTHYQHKCLKYLKGLLLMLLKTVAFIAGKTNPAIQKFFIRFSIEIKLTKLFQR